MKKPTLQEVAARANVSIGTASRAINCRARVSADARRAVKEAVNQLGYALPRSRERVIGVLTPTLEALELDHYFILMFNELRQAARRRGYRVIVVAMEDFMLLNEWQVNGVLSLDSTEKISRKFPVLKNIPLICCNDRANHLDNVYSINSNAEKVIVEAVEYLVGLGHRRIGFMRWSPTPKSLYADYFNAAMARHGLLHQAYPLLWNRDELPLHDAVAMQLARPVTALITLDSAIQVDRQLKLAGKRLPEDFSLVAGDTFHAEYMFPRHTTIAIDYPLYMETALNMLETVWRGGVLSKDVLINSKLRIRESTGPAPRGE